MRLVLVTPPASEPLTVAEAKAHLRVFHSGDDDVIEDMITTAREAVETYLGRALITQTWALKDDDFEASYRLPKAPLASVASITYVDSNGTTQTLAADQYVVLASGVDRACEPGRIVPAYNVVWPAVRGEPDDVVVQFVAGYGAASAVPQTFKSAMKVLLEDLYEERGSYVTGTIVAALPTAWERTLAPYRTPLSLVPVED